MRTLVDDGYRVWEYGGSEAIFEYKHSLYCDARAVVGSLLEAAERDCLRYVLNSKAEDGVSPKAGDDIDHPTHYTSHPSGVECIDVAEHMTFCAGNALKYLWRAGLKDGQSREKDLAKASWYVRREIARLEKLEKKISQE